MLILKDAVMTYKKTQALYRQRRVHCCVEANKPALVHGLEKRAENAPKKLLMSFIIR